MKLPLWRRHQDEELDEEIAGHLRMAIADRVARGENPDEAARAARLEFGNVGVVKEVTRDAWGWTALEQLVQDVRYACRTLRKAPGFTAVAVETLALGIGANSAMFSVINAVLLRPLPFPSPDALVAVESVDLRRGRGGAASTSASWPDFFDWRAKSQAFEHLSAYRTAGFTLAGADRSLHVEGAVVSSELFSTLGTQPVLGRGFRLEDERGGDVAVISDSLWRSQFSGASNVIGRPITLNARRLTVIGVMPAAFHFPISFPPAQVWVTVAEDARAESPDDVPMTTQRGAHFLKVIGRLGPSATIASAQADLDVIAAALAREFPVADGQRGVRVARQLDVLVGDTRQSLLVLLAAVGCVLLIACVNLANLLLARGAGRSHEIAMRAALGASARRIVRQLLTESLVLTTLGTACGLALAYGSIGLLARWSPVALRGLDQVAIDATVLAFTAGIAIVSGLAFGIVPAIQAAQTDPTLGAQGASRATAGRTQRRLRAALVVGETAVGVVLLVGAGLLLRSFDRLVRTPPGFDPDHVVTASFRLPESRYPYLKQIAFHDRLLADLRALPDVEAGAATAPLPMSGTNYSISFEQAGDAAPSAERQSAAFGMVSPGYLRAMHIPLVSGRDITEADNDAAPRVVIVNESFARRYFPDADPIGKRIKPGLSTTEKETPWREIVGVVRDIRHRSLGEPALPAYFIPYAQGLITPLHLVIRTRNTPGMADEVRKVIASMDPEVALYGVKTMEEYLATSVASPRFQTLLLAMFAGVGLALTAVGLYGVMAYGVAQRTREFGIRLALGARPGEVLGLVMRGGLTLVATGLAAGILAAGFATEVLAGALYGVDRLDPATFLGVAAVLLAVAMLASYLPARRATLVDPIRALRSE